VVVRLMWRGERERKLLLHENEMCKCMSDCLLACVGLALCCDFSERICLFGNPVLWARWVS
jgi:hypothetical protein